jgi:hypothetical protein
MEAARRLNPHQTFQVIIAEKAIMILRMASILADKIA